MFYHSHSTSWRIQFFTVSVSISSCMFLCRKWILNIPYLVIFKIILGYSRIIIVFELLCTIRSQPCWHRIWSFRYLGFQEILSQILNMHHQDIMFWILKVGRTNTNIEFVRTKILDSIVSWDQICEVSCQRIDRILICTSRLLVQGALLFADLDSLVPYRNFQLAVHSGIRFSLREVIKSFHGL